MIPETRPTLTLSMIVKNEENYLRECLESVSGLADEMILVDTGSVDRTIEIAALFGAKVFHFDWCSDFSAARNYALKQSTGNWILYLDADERLLPGSREKIIKLLKIPSDRKTGFRCLVNSTDQESENPKLMKYTRLFMNSPEICFTGKVHEQIDPSLKANDYIIEDSDIEILHIGYDIDNAGIKAKAQRNLALLFSEYENSRSSYYAYHLGITCEILGRKDESVKYFMEALQDINLNNNYRSICFLNLAVYYSSLLNFNESVRLLQCGIAADPENVMLHLVASDIYHKIGDTAVALHHCCLSLKFNSKIKSDGLSGSVFGLYINPSKICLRGIFLSLLMNDRQKFDAFFNELDNGIKLLINRLINDRSLNADQINKLADYIKSENADLLLLLAEKFAQKQTALNILLRLNKNYPEDIRFFNALGSWYYQNGELDQSVHYYRKALNAGIKDPSPVFYLIAAYVMKNDLSEVADLLEFAEAEYSHIPVVNEKLNILKQKLAGVLQ